MIRPNNPKKFLKSFNIKFNKFQSNMTNGVLLSYKNKNLLKSELKKIKNINILGFQIYEIKIINNLQIFCRIQIDQKNLINIYVIFINIYFMKIKENYLKKISIQIFKASLKMYHLLKLLANTHLMGICFTKI